MTSLQLEDFAPSPDEFVCSVSQVTMFELCPRKWAWRYLDGIPYTTKFTERGTNVHAMLEKWFRAGVLPPGMTVEGKLAQAMLLHYPPPQSVDPNNVELEYTFQIAGISFWLAVDLYLPDANVPTICDHKTTSDLKWAMQESEMHQDVQATLYAAWGMRKSNAPRVRVKWVYGTDRNAPKPDRAAISNWQPKTLCVERELCGADVRERLGLTIDTAKTIRAVRESGCSAIDVSYDATACDQLGGCPYKDKCNLTPEERMEAVMSGPVTRSELLAKLKAGKTNGAAAAATPQAVNPPAPSAAPVPAAPPAASAAPPAAGSLAERLAARAKAQQGVTAPAPAAPPPEPQAPKRGPGRPKGSTKTTPESIAQNVHGTLPFGGLSQDFVASAVIAMRAIAQKPEDRWAGFVSTAFVALTEKLDAEMLTDVEATADLVARAAQFADALQAEHDKRFRGRGGREAGAFGGVGGVGSS